MSETNVCVSPDEGYFDAWRISNEDAIERLRGVPAAGLHVEDFGRVLHVFGAVSDERVGRLLLSFSGSTGLGVAAVEPRRALAPIFHRLLLALPGGVPLVMWTDDGDEPELEPLPADPSVQQIADVLDRLD